ncbi:MAG TPA: ketoacyl-ACP synthase III [Flavobacteriales bacterium]|nr:ketoacyl-ACP synthase III [Flavobacterium sp.]HRE73246.1 ketoacyl-ACP synthase III [Flavobacteriales bacterium]HRJ39057.1 ketoacyl-ACP synthase III [Flavobacteriales bacterium]
MAQAKINKVRISAISCTVPANTVDNNNYEWITPDERNFLIKNTGIHFRRVAEKAICTSDMCTDAAERLFSDLNILKEDVDILVFVSQSPDYLVPATSMTIQDRLQLPKTTAAFDVNLGCSGYVYGLFMLASMLSSGNLKKGLLLAGDRATDSQNYKDKTSYPIFGDAGSATLIEFSGNENDVLFFDLNSDGSRSKAIHIPDGGTRNPFDENSEEEVEFEKGVIRSRRNLHMDGMGVFNFSIDEPPKSMLAVATLAGVDVPDHDYLILHQANKLINETIRRKLKVDVNKCPSTLNEFGNTSSASIPLTIVRHCEKNKIVNGKMLLSGFGVGLSWASCSLEMKNVNVTTIAEL